MSCGGCGGLSSPVLSKYQTLKCSRWIRSVFVCVNGATLHLPVGCSVCHHRLCCCFQLILGWLCDFEYIKSSLTIKKDKTSFSNKINTVALWLEYSLCQCFPSFSSYLRNSGKCLLYQELQTDWNNKLSDLWKILSNCGIHRRLS